MVTTEVIMQSYKIGVISMQSGKTIMQSWLWFTGSPIYATAIKLRRDATFWTCMAIIYCRPAFHIFKLLAPLNKLW